MIDRTTEAVRKQVRAMNTDVFEVGLYKPARDVHAQAEPEMLPRSWTADTLLQSIPWLKFQNRDGRNIYIRPKGEHALTLIDDLKIDAVEQMKQSGFAPALIIETSPRNFQAWLNHGRALPKEVSSAAARELASRFGGDRGSADWRHYGRLAGFTNRKPKHQMSDGRFPFVRLIHADGCVYPAVKEFLTFVETEVEARRRENERRRARFMRSISRSSTVKSIADFRRDPRYEGDGNRIDLAYAVYAISHGVPEDQVRAALATRDLTHKGTDFRQADYIERTVAKAIVAVRNRGGWSR